MKGKRTVIDWGKHEVTVAKQDGLLVHHLKDPDTVCVLCYSQHCFCYGG